MPQLLFFLLLTTIIAATGCKTPTTVGKSDLKKRSAKFLLQQLDKNTIQYDWFVAKSKANFETPKQSLGFALDIHIKKDSIIWIAGKKLGIEGVRARITPEKIEVLNHLEKTYLARPYSFLQQQFNLNLSFADLQNLLVGNPLSLSEEKITTSEADSRYVLSQPINGGDIALHLNANNFLIEKVVGKAQGYELNAEFKDYQPVNEQQIAFEKNLNVNNGVIKLDITFNKVELNQPAKTTFNVPEHYKQDAE